MKNFIKLIALIIMLTANYSFAADKELIIIRFNNDHVNYDKSLRKVVSSALEIKPETFFDIVTINPEGKTRRESLKNKEESENLTNEVVGKIKAHGIADDRLRVTYQASSDVSSTEVHIFVK